MALILLLVIHQTFLMGSRLGEVLRWHGHQSRFWCFWRYQQGPGPAERWNLYLHTDPQHKKSSSSLKHPGLLRWPWILPTTALGIGPQIMTDCGYLTIHPIMTMVVYALMHYITNWCVPSKYYELCQPGSRFEAPHTICRTGWHFINSQKHSGSQRRHTIPEIGRGR